MKKILNEWKRFLNEEVIGQTDNPSIVIYRVEAGDTESTIMDKFRMSLDDYKQLNPNPFKGEGSTVKVFKKVDPCEDFPDVSEEDLSEEIAKRLDLSNLKQAMGYNSMAGDIVFKVFAYGKLQNGKPAEYGYKLGSVEPEEGKGIDLGDQLKPDNKNQLLKLGRQIYVIEMMDLTGGETAKLFDKAPPAVLAQNDDDTVSLVQWNGKQFVKGGKKFTSPVEFTKEIVRQVDNMLKGIGGLEKVAKCAQKN